MVISAITDFEDVYYPTSTEEVKNILDLARTNDVNLIPMGNGSNVYNFMGSTTKPTSALCLKKLNKVIEINRRNLTASVEPGITLLEFQEVLKEYNIWLPVLSLDDKSRTIGGMIADNAYSYEKYLHKNIGDHIIGLEFVTPSGQIIKTGGKTVKNVGGYDFTHFLNGSMGTLGVITKVTLKLKSLPVTRKTFLFEVPDLEKGVEILREIGKMSLSVTSFHIFQFACPFNMDSFTDSLVIGAIGLEGSERVSEDHLEKISTYADCLKIKSRAIESRKFWDDFYPKYSSINSPFKIAGTVNKKYIIELTKLIRNNLKNMDGIIVDVGTGDFIILITSNLDYENFEVCLNNKLEDYSLKISSKRKPHPLYSLIKVNFDIKNTLFSNNIFLSIEDVHEE